MSGAILLAALVVAVAQYPALTGTGLLLLGWLMAGRVDPRVVDIPFGLLLLLAAGHFCFAIVRESVTLAGAL